MNAVTEKSTSIDPEDIVSGASSQWLAQLALGFEQRGNRTVLAHRHHQGPLVVQKPFYPEGETCHVYIVHPPGGVVGGDRLTVSVDVAARAHALITTPGSGKLYRSAGPVAQLKQHITVEAGGYLEWLPQDTILFSGCEVDMQTRIDLQPGAAFIGWEILCLGRPHSGETFVAGKCRQRFELWRDGQPLVLERSHLVGSAPLLDATWGLQGNPVTATLLATPAKADLLTAARDAVSDRGFSATLLDDVLVCRYLGKQGMQARNVFSQVWAAIRPGIMNKPSCPPRVWAT